MFAFEVFTVICFFNCLASVTFDELTLRTKKALLSSVNLNCQCIFVYITIICKTKTENKRKINKHLAENKVKKFSGPLPFRPQKNYILNRTPYARTLHAFI